MNKQLNLFEQNNIDDIKSEMLRRRKQILVHSCLYYRLDTNLIEDWQYDKIGRRLAELQIAYPEISNNLGYHDKEFKGFGEDHCYSGAFLPTSSPEVVATAERLLYLTSVNNKDKYLQKIFKIIIDMICSSLNYYEKHKVITRKETDDFIRTKGLSNGVFRNKKWSVRRVEQGHSTLYFKISS